jgi:hypothetical protein
VESLEPSNFSTVTYEPSLLSITLSSSILYSPGLLLYGGDYAFRTLRNIFVVVSKCAVSGAEEQEVIPAINTVNSAVVLLFENMQTR